MVYQMSWNLQAFQNKLQVVEGLIIVCVEV